MQGSSTSHGVGFTAEDSQKGRQLFLDMMRQAFAEVDNALPEHGIGPAVSWEQLAETLGETGL